MCIGVESEEKDFYKLLVLNDSGKIIKTVCDRLEKTPHNIVYFDDNILITFLTSSMSKVCYRTGKATNFTEVKGYPGSMVITPDRCVLVNRVNEQKRPILHKFTMEGRMVQEIDLSSKLQFLDRECILDIKPYTDGKFILEYNNKILEIDEKYDPKEISRLGESLKTFHYTSNKYGHIIFVTIKGEVFIVDKTDTLVKRYHEVEDLLRDDKVTCIAPDDQSRLWLGTRRGNIIIASYIHREEYSDFHATIL